MTVVANAAGEACFVITRRVSTLRNHSGQWALPGGRIDEGEEPSHAALRELDLRQNPREVAEAYRVPIAGLDAPGIPKLFDIPQSDRPVLSVRILGQDIFAPTAALVFQFRELAIHGRDTRVAQYDQPLFAWR
jgi:hypothetical protein